MTTHQIWEKVKKIVVGVFVPDPPRPPGPEEGTWCFFYPESDNVLLQPLASRSDAWGLDAHLDICQWYQKLLPRERIEPKAMGDNMW